MGERVISLFPGGQAGHLLRIDPLRLSLTVPQQEMAQIKPGQTVTFQTDAFPGQDLHRHGAYITPAVDQRQPFARASRRWSPIPDAVLRPGLFVTAELQLDKQRTDLYVPRRRRSAAGATWPPFSSSATESSASRSSPWARRRRAACGSLRAGAAATIVVDHARTASATANS